MKKISITVFATSLLLATISTQAQAWTRYGGENSCGTVFEQKDEATFAFQYKAWVFGFISAANEMTQTTYSDAPDGGGIWQAIILHCQNNPLNNLYDATVEVWVQLLQRNQ